MDDLLPLNDFRRNIIFHQCPLYLTYESSYIYIIGTVLFPSVSSPA